VSEIVEDRSVFVGASESPTNIASCTSKCIVIVDPLSTGAHVAVEAASRGYALIAVWDRDLPEDMKSHVPFCARKLSYYAEVDEKSSVQETAAAVRAAAEGLTIVACIVGSEYGVTLADALSTELELRTNGNSAGRRDKKVQQELVREAGLRSVRQAGGMQWSDVKAFVEEEPMPVVLKPVESAGSDGVKLCHTREEAEEHFTLLMGAQNQLGCQNASVLVQEFLKGNEYVVDHVSRDGEHKTTMVWVYDKRVANGAAFVYYGMLPVRSDSAVAKEIIAYVRGVLDALGIKNGPTHGEVMMTQRGPCLVEMNCRAHGGDGAWVPLATELTGGYTQVNGTIDAFVDEEAFAKIPQEPPAPLKASGQNVMLVSFAEGTVASTPGFEKIKAMESFVSMETGVSVGSKVTHTVDIFTSVGQVILMHHDAQILQRDVEEIRKMETECSLFEFEPRVEILGRPRALSEMGVSKIVELQQARIRSTSC